MSSAPALLITGAGGYLGRHLAPLAAARYQVYATYHANPDRITAGQPVLLDLADRAAVHGLVQQLAPAVIIHTAAINPGAGDEAVMMRVNAAGSRHLAEAAAAVGSRLIHVSSDVVHNGRAAPYPDEASPAPLNGYGRSKAAAEAAVREFCPQAAIVRTSLIYGLTIMDRGTAGFAERLAREGGLVLFSDVIRQPVEVNNLSEALLRLAESDFSGLLNVAGRQAITRTDFGRKMLAYWGVEIDRRVQTGRAADISDTIPLDLRLDISQGQTLLGMTFLGVDEVLAAA